MFKVLSILTSLVLFASISGAEVPVLNLKNSGSMGYVPTATKLITSNKTSDLSVSTTTVDLDENRNLSVLGCGALDTHEARLSVLREDTSRLNDFFSTPVSNFMVTTLFNSPAVAQIFNGLENFSGSRVRELQDRCAAMEYKDDLASAQWASVQACIDSVVKANFDDAKNAEVMADAFKYCLSSPDYNKTSDDASTAGTSLQDAAKGILKDPKWNGSLFSALQNTRACIDTVNGKSCDIFAYLPNVRWCTLTNKANFKECAKNNGGDPTTDVGSGETIISAEAISPMQIFDASFGLSRAFVNYAMVYAGTLQKMWGRKTAMSLAQLGENTVSKLHIAGTASNADVIAGFHGTDRYTGSGNQPDPNNSDMALYNFVNCSSTVTTRLVNGKNVSDPLWEDFNSTTGITDLNSLARLPKPLAGFIIYGDFFDKSALKTSDSSVLYDPEYARNMVAVATKCAMRDELRLALTDYVALHNNEDSSDAALLGYRTQVAYAATRNLLRFIVYRLQLAQLDLALNVSTDPNSPPPHVRLALESIIDSFKGRLLEMENRREQQRDYASVITKFH